MAGKTVGGRGSNQYQARGRSLEIDASPGGDLMQQAQLSAAAERKLAKDPNTDARRLQRLAGSSSIPVLRELARNPNTPPHVLARLVVQATSWPLASMFGSERKRQQCQPIISAAVANPAASDAHLRGALLLAGDAMNTPDDAKQKFDYLDAVPWSALLRRLPPAPSGPQYANEYQQELVRHVQGFGLGEVAHSWGSTGPDHTAAVVCTDGWYMVSSDGMPLGAGYVDPQGDVPEQMVSIMHRLDRLMGADGSADSWIYSGRF